MQLSHPFITSRPLIFRETAVNLRSSIVPADSITATLYCGVSETNIPKLKRMHHNLIARVVCKSSYTTDVTELMRELH